MAQRPKPLTNQDLDDIVKEVEKDGDAKLEWVFENNKEGEKESPLITPNHLISEEYLHFDSGRHHYQKPETWGNKFHYGVLKLINTHPKKTLLNAKIIFQYELGNIWQMRTENMYFEAPPAINQRTEYTVRRKSHSFIDKYFKSKEDFERFHYKYYAKQEITTTKKDNKPFVKSEEMDIGNMPPNSERFLIFKCHGWTTRVQFIGDFKP